ncbi:hypothetical protein, partial [Tepidicella xavieri]
KPVYIGASRLICFMSLLSHPGSLAGRFCRPSLILGEPFNAWVLAGTVLVLAGVLWVSRQ